jgi:MFS family permease
VIRRVLRLPRNVLGLGGVSFCNDVSSEMIYPLLPTFLVNVLGASVPAVGLIEGASESVNAFIKLWAGSLSDRLRRKKPLVLLGYGLASLARPLIALSGAVWQVLMLRLADRLGKGVRSAPRDALLAESATPEVLGLAFGTQRALDHAGALVGPLVAVGLLHFVTHDLRLIIALAAVPAAATLVLLWRTVREVPVATPAGSTGPTAAPPLTPPLRRTFLVFFVFTLGNSTDAFLLLRAGQLGVATAMLPLLWAALHVSKTFWSFLGGDWADRIGARTTIGLAWIVYAAVYAGFALAAVEWQAWALFVVYGIYFGLSEGPEKALIARVRGAVPLGRAMGGYQLAVGAGALPASLAFGFLWSWIGPLGAFLAGAGIAGLAVVLLFIAVEGDQRTQARRRATPFAS